MSILLAFLVAILNKVQLVFITKNNQLIIFKKIICYSENHTKPKNTLHGNNAKKRNDIVGDA